MGLDKYALGRAIVALDTALAGEALHLPRDSQAMVTGLRAQLVDLQAQIQGADLEFSAEALNVELGKLPEALATGRALDFLGQAQTCRVIIQEQAPGSPSWDHTPRLDLPAFRTDLDGFTLAGDDVTEPPDPKHDGGSAAEG